MVASPISLTQFHSIRSVPLKLASLVRDLPVSATLAINEAVAQKRKAGEDILHLGFGQSSFPLHPKMVKAFTRAAKKTNYAPVAGIPALRQVIADHLDRTRGVTYSSANIIVAPGSKPLLYTLLQALQGDLLLPIPSWVSYIPQAKLAGKKIYGVETDAADRHRLTPANLQEAVERAKRAGGDPRILILNSPNNPTGSMFDEWDVCAMSLWARQHGITIISDEIYAEVAHGWRRHISPAVYYPEGTIITGGISKSFSAGGWRLGYAAFPTTPEGLKLTEAVKGLASEIWSSASTPVQEAAILAFSPIPEIESYVRASALLHGHMADELYSTLVGLGVYCPRPAGGFYLYPDFRPWKDALAKQGVYNDVELSMYLLDRWKIATLPGSEFGDKPENLCLRLATSMLFEDPGESPTANQAMFWELLARAKALESVGEVQSQKPFIELISLERVKSRFTEVVDSLSHQI